MDDVVRIVDPYRRSVLIAAIILITSALVLYTLGVWGERRQGLLRPWHAAAFAAGFTCDASGTYLMSLIATSGTFATTGVATTLTSLMAVTGALALVLMGLHLAWAVVVLWKGSEGAKRVFHRFSLGVWVLWLIPFFTGMAGAMVR